MRKSHRQTRRGACPAHPDDGFEPPLLFYHPFAYAAQRSLDFGCAMRESLVPERSAA